MLKSGGFQFEGNELGKEMSMLFMFSVFVVSALQRQGSGAAAGNNKTSGGQGKKKT